LGHSVFEMTESKPVAAAENEDELDQKLESAENLNENSVEEQANTSVVKKPKDDEWKLAYEGERADPAELLDDGFVDIARLEPGACFGELALIDGKPRMATIKCITRCHFLILNRSDYGKSIKDQDRKKRNDRGTLI